MKELQVDPNSQLEQDLLWQLERVIAVSTSIQTQYRVETIGGAFVLDFLLCDARGRKICLECDGQDFHDEYRDEWRDAMILGDSDIFAVYRLPGAVLFHHMVEALFVLSRAEPSLFSDRGRANLRAQVDSSVRELKFGTDETHLRYLLRASEDRELTRIVIERKHKDIPAGKRQFWQSLYRFAREAGGGQLDALMDRYRIEQDRLMHGE